MAGNKPVAKLNRVPYLVNTATSGLFREESLLPTLQNGSEATGSKLR
jgi:hypothetical protein